MRVLVQKYGGKCVEHGGNDLITIERIKDTINADFMPIPVVSAMGREFKYTEDIIEALKSKEKIRDIALTHFYSTAELVNIVRSIGEKISPRELDIIMSCGELISSVHMSHLLNCKGVESVSLTGGQAGLYTDGFFGRAKVVKTDVTRLIKYLKDNVVPFVAGFQGVTEDEGAITTLGEGGSDYTAVVLGAAIKNAQIDGVEMAGVEIYKDVDGVMSANPANFKNDAPPILNRNLTFDEMCAMSKYGADVIQAESARLARSLSLPVVVRNFKNPTDPGTVINSHTPISAPSVVGIADMPSLVVFTTAESSVETRDKIIALLEGERLNYQVILTASGAYKFGLKKEKYRDIALFVGSLLQDNHISFSFDEDNWALVTIVGEKLRESVDETADKALTALKVHNIDVVGYIKDDLSYSVLVKEVKRIESIILLHNMFITGN